MTVYLDTNCVIYFVERHSVWWPKVVGRVTTLRASGHELAVGDLTVAECLVGPFKHGDAVAEASYRAFFADPDVRAFPMTSAGCERAARIRAAYNLKLPDALHLATAVEHGCGLFLTNDGTLTRAPRSPWKCSRESGES